MKLYRIDDNNELISVRNNGFSKERQIQDIVEHNISKLLGLYFLADEYQIDNYRLDTVAYDVDNKSFVIIEYKNEVNDSIVDQGYAYLNTLLSRKDSFVRLYEHQHDNKEMDINFFDWDQTKILFIAPSYTDQQIRAVDNPNIAIELYEINKFDDNVLTFDHIQKHPMPRYANDNSYRNKSKFKKQNLEIDSVRDLKPISEDDLVQKGNDNTRNIYDTIKNTVLKWDSNIDINPTKIYIGFKINGKDFMDIEILVNTLNVSLNMKKGTLKDDLRKARDMSHTGMYGNGDYQVKVKDMEVLPYIYKLIKQSMEYNSKP